jgi:hypothetical protein
MDLRARREARFTEPWHNSRMKIAGLEKPD